MRASRRRFDGLALCFWDILLKYLRGAYYLFGVVGHGDEMAGKSHCTYPSFDTLFVVTTLVRDVGDVVGNMVHTHCTWLGIFFTIVIEGMLGLTATGMTLSQKTSVIPVFLSSINEGCKSTKPILFQNNVLKLGIVLYGRVNAVRCVAVEIEKCSLIICWDYLRFYYK